MGDSALNRAPVEIWERILLEVISRITTPIFETSCTPSNYLAFKRTCGDGDTIVYQHEYKESERSRRALRQVCRAWRAIADRWDNRERWIRVSALDKQISEERWRGAQRVEFVSPSGMGIWNGNGTKAHETGGLRAVLFDWRLLGLPGGSGMRLRRLEMLHITESGFGSVIQGLCDAAPSLTCLRSLSLSVPTKSSSSLHAISEHFHRLTHLTLRMTFTQKLTDFPDFDSDDELDSQSEDDGGRATSHILRFPKLEVLFLFPVRHCFDLTNWVLPMLRHVHVRPVGGIWGRTILPFLERHASTIETLDMDDVSTTAIPLYTSGLAETSNVDTDTLDFWDTFAHLKLLRCKIGRNGFSTYPDQHHAFECLVSANPVVTADDFTAVLGPWVHEDRVKKLKSIVLFGPYMSRGAFTQKGPVRAILQQLRWNGTRLLNPAGREWIDMP